ncbi:MAG TPA: hypothetical protein PL059_09375 [Spirochaetota bacterium]|nr:hypothetical protein [Spirochaetota bacterium]HOM10536.1 hypothetical protein [Spirochaetota bacterium]HPP49864.1 hypothetical protein [Spirochaetota bacterium]
MALEQKDIEFIESYLKENLPRILVEQSLAKPPVVYEIELRERMVRVEEELKHQRELMKEGFDQINKRLELLENRFDVLSRRLFQFMVWTFGLVVSSTGIIIAFMKMQ